MNPLLVTPITATLPPLTINQMSLFPTTRFMGSKSKLLSFIWENVKHLQFHTVLDAFSGSGCVGYMFKTKGKQVVTNDILKYAANISAAIIENNGVIINEDDLEILTSGSINTDAFIRETFKGLYFSDKENHLLEKIISRITMLDNKHKKSIALSALCRACVKKRPRGIFTYVGARYDDGRKDLRITLDEHFHQAITVFNQAVFSNHQNNLTYCGDIFEIPETTFDLVYIDPPYFSTRSDNDYMRRYHFVEGLCSYWRDAEIDYKTKTKKLKKRPTRFSSKSKVYSAFDELFSKFKDSILVVSYSSNSIKRKNEMLEMLKKHRDNVEIAEMDYKYFIGNQAHKVGDNKNSAKEYLFVAY